MSKRFMVDDCGTLIDMTNRNTYDYVSDVCDLLNEQHETIQRLKQNIDELMCVNVEEELLKENEQLKSRVHYLERKIERERNSTHKQYAKWEKEAEDKIKELSEENEQLKTFLESLKEELSLADRDNTILEKENEELKQRIDNICREINDKPTMTTTEVMVKLQGLIF